MTLVKWNPARELMNIEKEFNKIFNSFSNRYGFAKENEDEMENAVWSPLTDISEDNDNYYLHLDIPGVEKGDVKISYSNGNLIIKGERKEEKETKKSEYHRIERSFGKFYRSFTLPEKVKEDKIEAKFKDGSLSIVIPKADEVKPREIEVKIS